MFFISLDATYKRATSSCGLPPAAYDLFKTLTLESLSYFGYRVKFCRISLRVCEPARSAESSERVSRRLLLR